MNHKPISILLFLLSSGWITGVYSINPDPPRGGFVPLSNGIYADDSGNRKEFMKLDSFRSYIQKLGDSSTAISMIAIPEGIFLMGSPINEPGRNPDEGPQTKIKLNGFWMSKYEITWNIYNQFVYSTASSGRPQSVDAVTGPTKPFIDITFGMGTNNHPAVSMTHYNAIKFCEWLYKSTGNFYRLPTEAEWEYACRAGTTSAYSFADDSSVIDDFAWYHKNSNGKTHPVGTKKPNQWGLHDMHGNVSEWTYDQYVANFYTENKLTVNPVAVPSKLYPHVIRGGSFIDGPDAIRSAGRGKSDPQWKRLDPQVPKSNWWFPEAPFIGVRIVRPFHTPTAEKIKSYYNIELIPEY